MYHHDTRFLSRPRTKVQIVILIINIFIVEVPNLRQGDIASVIVIRMLVLRAGPHLLVDRLIKFIIALYGVRRACDHLEAIQNATVNLHQETYLEIFVTYNLDRESWLVF